MPEKKTAVSVRKKVLLVDTSKCIGCRACQMACKEWHETKEENLIETDTVLTNGYENPSDLSYKTWIRVQNIEVMREGKTLWLFRPILCMHCSDAACISVCPQTNCIYKDGKSGNSVVLNDSRCIGCLYCVYACPFSVPRYNPKTKTTYKCSRCYEKIDKSSSQLPNCVQACPTGALVFGESEEIEAIAKKRVSVLQESGKNNICLYGNSRAYLGGLGVVYILETTNVQLYGLPEFPRISTTVSTWQDFWKPLLYIAPAVVLFLWILHYMFIGPLGVKIVEEKEEDEEIEITEEEYQRMIATKRRAGKMMQDLDPKELYRRRKSKKGKKSKGKPK
ncbi:MAG: 4Fe-4S dicluster domain-containing protein [Planctomycetota bacterium]